MSKKYKKKKKNSKDEQEKSTAYWRGFWSFLILSAISSFALTGKYGGGWIAGFIICVFLLLICFYLGISSSSKVKKINKEVEKLERERKDLRNSIR